MSESPKYAMTLTTILLVFVLACGTPNPEPTAQVLQVPPTQAPLPTYTPYPTYTPFPTPVHTHTPLPTNTPEPPTQPPLPTYTPYPTNTPFPTSVPARTPLPTNTPEPPTQPPLPTYTPYPTNTPFPTSVPARTPLATNTPELPTQPPLPTYTPYPTYTPLPTPETAYTPSPTPTPSPETILGGIFGFSIDNPAPRGESLRFYDGLTVAVVDVIEDATKIVLEHEQMLNASPPVGYQYLLVTIEVNNVDRTPADMLFLSTLSLVGSSGISYLQGIAGGDCWTYPNELDTLKTIFPGGSIMGNLCFSVPSSEVGTLIMFVQNFYGQFLYWALELDERESSEVLTPPVQEILLEVSVSDIVKDYKEHEVRADAKYSKPYTVSGKVGNIEGGSSGILEFGGLGLSQVKAYFQNKEDLLDVDKGDTVLLRCEGADAGGDSWGVFVNLRNCTVVPSSTGSGR